MKTHAVPTIQSGYRCENGAVRQRNEDACLALSSKFGGHFDMQPVGLFVVADGMGGEREGHMASNAATRAFADHVLTNLYLPLLREHPLPREGVVVDTLERAVFAAHEAVVHSVANGGSPASGNGGTTLTAAFVLGRRLYIAHVGDSRAYLLAGDELRPLTEDHSLVRRLQETGRLSLEDAQNFQYRNVLLQALGQSSALTADTFTLDLPDDGQLLLCSDGLCGVVPLDEIAAVLRGGGSPQEAADRLYEAAMAAGGADNITAIVVHFAL